MKGFGLVLFLMLLCLRSDAGEGDGDEFNSLREGDGSK